ncbi:hypothetical protein [Nocardia puris]|uniref:Uncharacterized protein n=1 Tax=Nocardia puris TaxID=208602 RepID=A0A366DMN5_9NOCA|nr:hypothetical protein [Nocardia puris]RBO91306.1 hypothetical protein DFR74_1048 [Nocardia puris]
MSSVVNPYAVAIDSGNFHAGVACWDCVLALANGENGPAEPSWDAARFAATCQEYDVTLGHTHSGPYSTCPHAGQPCADDCDCERDTFSRRDCSVCGSHLHGCREDVIMIRWADLERGDA